MTTQTKEETSQTQTVDVEAERVSKDEMNIAEYPITLLTRRAPKGVKTIKYSDWVKIGGKKKRLEWIVTGSDEFGLPLGGDQDVYVAIMEAWREQGFKDNVIQIESIYKMLQKMGLPINKQNYLRFKQALDRLTTMSIVAENAFWDKEGQCYISRKGFHIFEEYNLIERFTEQHKNPSVPAGYIRASEFFHRSVKAGFLKSIDLKFYLSLSTPLIKRLYRYLDKKRYNNATFAMELYKFSRKIGLMAGKLEKYHPSQLKQVLNPALDELKDKGFLKSYDYQTVSTQEEKKEKILFTFGDFPQQPQQTDKEDYQTEALVQDIISFTGAEHSRAWYTKAIKILGPELATNSVYLALSLSRDADHRGEIRTSRDRFFISTLKRISKEHNIFL